MDFRNKILEQIPLGKNKPFIGTGKGFGARKRIPNRETLNQKQEGRREKGDALYIFIFTKITKLVTRSPCRGKPEWMHQERYTTLSGAV
jgi:hypothetical protein